MILISEFLPDPQGADAHGEWVELVNDGNEKVSLSGWRLQNSKGKKYILKSTAIEPHEYLVLARDTTKLTLKNQDETISLYDARGMLVDTAHFSGTAQSGQSFNRVSSDGVTRFVLGEPTPGAVNKASNDSLVAHDTYGPGQTFETHLNRFEITGLALGTGLLMAAVIIGVERMFGDLLSSQLLEVFEQKAFSSDEK